MCMCVSFFFPCTDSRWFRTGPSRNQWLQAQAARDFATEATNRPATIVGLNGTEDK